MPTPKPSKTPTTAAERRKAKAEKRAALAAESLANTPIMKDGEDRDGALSRVATEVMKGRPWGVAEARKFRDELNAHGEHAAEKNYRLTKGAPMEEYGWPVVMHDGTKRTLRHANKNGWDPTEKLDQGR